MQEIIKNSYQYNFCIYIIYILKYIVCKMLTQGMMKAINGIYENDTEKV